MDETGWDHDLGFAQKPMVLSPLKEEQDVYYRAVVVFVNRQRMVVSSVVETASGTATQQQHTARLHLCISSSTA